MPTRPPRARLGDGGTPTWKDICNVADERDASLIVLGSHGRTGLAGVAIGSAAAVASHSRLSVLITIGGFELAPHR
jgi:nucleotide-binding universal stress UspA family protein